MMETQLLITGSFLSYVLNKARKWRSKKKTNGKGKVYHEPESDGEDIKLSIGKRMVSEKINLF